MAQVSRPMQILLLATVLFAAVWFVALRPKASGDSGGSAAAPAPAVHAAPTAPGVKGLGRAIDKAHAAVGTANAAGQRAAGAAASASTPAASVHGAAAAASRAATAPKQATAHRVASHVRVHVDPAVARRVAAVRAALRHRKGLAIAFVDPATADGRAVAVEVRHVGGFGTRALTLAVPIGDLSRYGFITNEVQITTAPTTVIVAPGGKATTIVGYADRFEIAQRLADALASKRS